MAKKVTRLYSQFQPTHYAIDLHPDRDSLTFKGTVIIKGKKVGPPSKRIVFHQKDLKITSAKIIKNEKFPIERINLLKSADEVRLHSTQTLYGGEYTIELEFSGTISRQMNGMYPCYFKHDGKDKMLIATQFESHHAREAFPCIDEPEAKAVFNLTLTTPNGETVIANTPIKTQEKSKEGLRTNFVETPKMSTYLLAFIYGELEYTESNTANGTNVRVYATPDNVDYTKFALECAVKTLEFYNKYFAIPYPLPKCDFIALPDFASGAMENWGCITFREQALLVDPKNTSLHLKQYVANVVAHELTHQWFGNLVTMRWWSDLWLNESFASWMSYLAVDHLFPDWKVWVQFIVDEQGYALKIDALENTHPIQVTINHPDEIRTIFDAISYEKGASVLLMLYTYLGAEAFRDGLRYYLKEHSYGNTDTTDLWKALEKHSQLPVVAFMEAWTSTSGYPVITTSVNGSDVEVSQERFYLNPAAKKEKAIWPIPLTPNIELGKSELSETKQTFKLSIKSKEPLIINHDRPSFYRTIYSSEHLAQLATAIESGTVSDLDRLGILNDSFEAAKAGYSKSTDSLSLLSAYAHESSPLVWDVISGGLGSIRTVMNNDSIRKNMKPFARKLAAEQLRLGRAKIR
jgi:aminopeptidase N